MERMRELYHQNFKLVSYKCWSGSEKKKKKHWKKIKMFKFRCSSVYLNVRFLKSLIISKNEGQHSRNELDQ